MYPESISVAYTQVIRLMKAAPALPQFCELAYIFPKCFFWFELAASGSISCMGSKYAGEKDMSF